MAHLAAVRHVAHAARSGAADPRATSAVDALDGALARVAAPVAERGRLVGFLRPANRRRDGLRPPGAGRAESVRHARPRALRGSRRLSPEDRWRADARL